MIAMETLQRYIALCDNVISKNDYNGAETLENEIISVFDNEISGIRGGLSNYSPCFLGSTPYGTVSDNIDVDYLKDIALLKSKLQVELERNQIDKSMSVSDKKSKKVFISHATNDKPFVQLIVNLLEDIGLAENEIVCSSIPGYGIPLGKDIYDWLSEQFQNFDLHVMFILSANYYSSVACLNEMGAAWVLKQKYDTVLLPDFDFPQIKGAINPQQIGIKLDSDCTELNQSLNELKDSLIDEFEIQSLSAAKWERHRNEFVRKLALASKEICDDSTSNNSESKSSISKDAAVLLAYAANDASGRIIMVSTLGGLSVCAGKWNFVDPNGGARENARWNGAVDELESYGLIEDGSYKHQVFAVTHTGYKIADEIKEELEIDFGNSPDQYLAEN